MSPVLGAGPVYSALLFSVGAGGLLSTTESPQDISIKLVKVKIIMKLILFGIKYFDRENLDTELSNKEDKSMIILPYNKHQLQRKHA